MNIIQKVRTKIQQTSIDVFLNQSIVGVNRLLVLVYLITANDGKTYSAKKYYLSKCVIKNYNVIINGKNFNDQPIDSDLKRYEEMRKLTTGQGKDYTTGCLLNVY